MAFVEDIRDGNRLGRVQRAGIKDGASLELHVRSCLERSDFLAIGIQTCQCETFAEGYAWTYPQIVSPRPIESPGLLGARIVVSISRHSPESHVRCHVELLSIVAREGNGLEAAVFYLEFYQ